MKLSIPYIDFCEIIGGQHYCGLQHEIISGIAYDSRKISSSEGQVFFALKGEFRDGHNFLIEAFQKGIRIFVVSEVPNKPFKDASYLLVNDTMEALQKLALYHRKRFNYPIIAVTGSNGKTTVKEWLYHLLSPKFRIIRSPKSYNSQLGVALSLLELHDKADLAIIEAGISKSGEMKFLEKMILPDYGIFTSFGTSHEEGFSSIQEHLNEKLKLFSGCKKTFVSFSIDLSKSDLENIHGVEVNPNDYLEQLRLVPFQDRASVFSAMMAIAVAKDFGYVDVEQVKSLPRLAMRMETFDGIDNSIIINDTYNLDLDALEFSLEYQASLAGTRKRVVIVGIDEQNKTLAAEVERKIQKFQPDYYSIIYDNQVPTVDVLNSVVLVKGTRKLEMQKLAARLKLKKHKTYLEINLSAMKHNVQVFRSLLNSNTKMLAMVKAQSYGSGLEKVGLFLESQGIEYLGVAYPDEGVELRKAGVKIPILVMNPVEEGFEDCIKYQLEPAIYCFEQLDELLHELIFQGIQDFPVHLKIDTGMKRLGFDFSDLPKLMELIQAQPEVKLTGVYSHLADSDNRRDRRFTDLQKQRVKDACRFISNYTSNSLLLHLLNSEGIANYQDAQFDMVRIGIGMYGISSNPNVAKKLKPVIAWKSTISQVKHVVKGESIGYSRSFVAEKDMQIAIIPVGYADGFRRSLSNGKGTVIVNGIACKVLGRVCMDMIMVDVSRIQVKPGDMVEIIGEKQTLSNFSEMMQTIPYEVLTSISKRVHRTYIEE